MDLVSVATTIIGLAVTVGVNACAFLRNTNELRRSTAAKRVEMFLTNDLLRKAYNQIDVGDFEFPAEGRPLPAQAPTLEPGPAGGLTSLSMRA